MALQICDFNGVDAKFYADLHAKTSRWECKLFARIQGSEETICFLLAFCFFKSDHHLLAIFASWIFGSLNFWILERRQTLDVAFK